MVSGFQSSPEGDLILLFIFPPLKRRAITIRPACAGLDHRDAVGAMTLKHTLQNKAGAPPSKRRFTLFVSCFGVLTASIASMILRKKQSAFSRQLKQKHSRRPAVLHQKRKTRKAKSQRLIASS